MFVYVCYHVLRKVDVSLANLQTQSLERYNNDECGISTLNFVGRIVRRNVVIFNFEVLILT